MIVPWWKRFRVVLKIDKIVSIGCLVIAAVFAPAEGAAAPDRLLAQALGPSVADGACPRLKTAATITEQ